MVWGLGGALTASGCGGHSARNGEEPRSGGTAGSAGDTEAAGRDGGGGTSGTAGDGDGGRVTLAGASGASGGVGGATHTPRGCPDASWASCDAGLALTVRVDGPTEAADGVWVEPLQVPTSFPQSPSAPPPEALPTPPAKWDRSALPAGACVFRVHGVPADCLGRSGRVTFGACVPGPVPVPLGYYELPNCDQGIAPGCPSDYPYAGENYIWYSVPEPSVANETTLVLCAGLCATAAQTGVLCLHHSRLP